MTSSNRDDFTKATIRKLAHRAGYRCSFPNCTVTTAGPSEESLDATSNIGVACHITAAAPGGPRHDENLSSVERKSISNGIWMCQNHAKLIDDDEVIYTEDDLKAWKQEAEDRARDAMVNPGAHQDADTRLDHFENELNRLVAHRLRDALTPMQETISLFLQRHGDPEANQLFNRHDADNVTREDLAPIIDVLCSDAVMGPTEGPPLTPSGITWMKYILHGVERGIELSDQALLTYAGRGDLELVCALEELKRRSELMLYIMVSLVNQGQIKSSPARSYMGLLVQRILWADAVWHRWLVEVYSPKKGEQ